ncbi:MAG: hypothetical protein DRI65_13310, partial [Chloroflexota bacterium]
MEDKSAHDHELSRREKNRVAAENQLDFYFELHSKGVPISEHWTKQLIASGHIDDPSRPGDDLKEPIEKKGYADQVVQTKEAIKADMFVDIIEGEGDPFSVMVTDKEFHGERRKFRFQGREIKKADWAPKSTMAHEADFVAWIDSINAGFVNMVFYEKFHLYCQQASTWLADPTDITDFRASEDRRRYGYNEFNRSDENSLYWLDKYLKLKDGKDETIS